MRLVALLFAAAAIAGAIPASAADQPSWQQWRHVPGVFDVAGSRSDGRLVVAANGRLVLMSPSGATRSFAPSYSVPVGPESYIALSPGLTPNGSGCRFDRDDVLALDLRINGRPAIATVSAGGKVGRLASIPGAATLDGIALDTVGTFGRRLLVVGPVPPGKTQVTAVDCRGRTTTIGTVDVPLEGGIAVAPPSFGPYGGQLIAANELDGSVYAVSPAGRLRTVVRSGLRAGGDIGVESVGFVPARATAAYVADRGTPGSPHPGTDSILRLTGTTLERAGVRAGDLLVATEGAATTIRVRCRQTCAAAVVASGPPTAHGEGRLLVVGRISRSSTYMAAIAIGIAAILAFAAVAVVLLLRRGAKRPAPSQGSRPL